MARYELDEPFVLPTLSSNEHDGYGEWHKEMAPLNILQADIPYSSENALHLNVSLNLNLANAGDGAGAGSSAIVSASASATAIGGGSSYRPSSKSSKNEKKEKIPCRAGKPIVKTKHGNKDRITPTAEPSVEDKAEGKAKGTKKNAKPKKKRKDARKIRLAALVKEEAALNEENEMLEKVIAEVEEKYGYLLVEEDAA